jgi:hypothetical protein
VTPLEHIMGLMDPTYPEPIRRSMAQGILDKHAHELAGRQRAELDDLFDRYERTFHEDAFTDLIAVIDPKEQRP